MAYRFHATQRFWKGFAGLSEEHKQIARRKFAIFKRDPFDPRLGAHRIHCLSAILKRTGLCRRDRRKLACHVYIEGSTVVTTDVGSHDIYRRH